ncbi:hypothetical protein FA13DRAFT_1715046, partial [Coprinellus micaceus]
MASHAMTQMSPTHRILHVAKSSLSKGLAIVVCFPDCGKIAVDGSLDSSRQLWLSNTQNPTSHRTQLSSLNSVRGMNSNNRYPPRRAPVPPRMRNSEHHHSVNVNATAHHHVPPAKNLHALPLRGRRPSTGGASSQSSTIAITIQLCYHPRSQSQSFNPPQCPLTAYLPDHFDDYSAPAPISAFGPLPHPESNLALQHNPLFTITPPSSITPTFKLNTKTRLDDNGLPFLLPSVSLPPLRKSLDIPALKHKSRMHRDHWNLKFPRVKFPVEEIVEVPARPAAPRPASVTSSDMVMLGVTSACVRREAQNRGVELPPRPRRQSPAPIH